MRPSLADLLFPVFGASGESCLAAHALFSWAILSAKLDSLIETCACHAQTM